jgi:glycosyltransferase involved in cell wall biosynthesis
MRPRRIALLGVQVPFIRGGAEVLLESLRDQLVARGFEVDLVRLPYAWEDRVQILKSALTWRLLDLERSAGTPIDLVIASRFPSYAVRHPNKVVWLIHQHRQAYDLLGTRYSDFDGKDPRDQRAVEMIRALDRRTLGEARGLFTIAANVSRRLERFNGLPSTPLYPPPPLGDAYRTEGYGDFVLGVGRLDPLKRFDLLVEALPHAPGVKAIIAGTGPERERLLALARRLGVAERLELPGWVEPEELLSLYARCRAVFYAPFDEDYGYVTVEAMKSGKPVVTATDAGAVLEFVEDGVTGWVCPPGQPRAMGDRLARLGASEELARRLGERGRERARGIGWDVVIAELTATL